MIKKATHCLKPFFVKNDGKETLVNCGKCFVCKRKRLAQWSFRVMQEHKKSNSAKFITLTYDDNNMPITQNGYRSLLRYDLELFFKRLRRAHKQKGIGGRTIKYIAAGEYGGKIGRPHYHIILFNADWKKVARAWSSRNVVNTTVRLKRRNRNGQLNKVVAQTKWQPIGHINYGDKRGVTEASVGYVLKYILKPKADNKDKRDDSEKEFVTFSKGVGLDYLYDTLPEYCMAWNDQTNKKQKVLLKPGKLSSNVRWHHADTLNRMYVNSGYGRKCSMPRYYKEKIYTDLEREKITAHVRNKLTEEIYKDLLKYTAKEFATEQRNFKEYSNHQYKLQSRLKVKSYG